MEKATFDQYLELGQKLKEGSLDRDLMQAMIEGRAQVSPPRQCISRSVFYPVTIDPSITYDEALHRITFNHVDERINEKNFPIKFHKGRIRSGQKETHTHLYLVNEGSTTDEILASMTKGSAEPATLMELLAFGAEHPAATNLFHVVALDTLIRDDFGDLVAPELSTGGSNVGLGLKRCGDRAEWGSPYSCQYACLAIDRPYTGII